MPPEDPARLLRVRLAAQRLTRPARDPHTACRHLLAIQAQDPRGFRLAIRARTTDATTAELHRELTDRRSLVVSWLNRGTLHLVSREDYFWLQALTTPPLWTGSRRRLAQEGVSERDAERAVALVERWLADEGPLTRVQLRERLDRAGLRTAGQALIHVLYRCALSGVLVRGPLGTQGVEQEYVRVADWLGGSKPVERDAALGELARRYLVAHAPADERDLARWAGLPLRDARVGLERISTELVRGDDGLLSLRGRDPGPTSVPAPMLLGPYEPVLLGWRSREFVVGSHDAALVSGGLFRAFALIDGQAAATWRLQDGQVQIEPLRALTAAELAALQRDGERALAYLQLRR